MDEEKPARLVYGLFGVMIIVSLMALALAACAQSAKADGIWSPFWEAQEPEKPKAKPRVYKAPEKVPVPTEKPPEVVDKDATTVLDQTNLYIALFSSNDRLYWTGQVSGKVRFSGASGSLASMTMECIDKTVPCVKWRLKEDVNPQIAVRPLAHVSFWTGSRLIVWPHTFLLSQTPFKFEQSPVISNF